MSRRIFANFLTSLSKSVKRSTSASSTAKDVLLARVETSVAMLSSSNSFMLLLQAAFCTSRSHSFACHSSCFAFHTACLASHSAIFFALSSCRASHSTLFLAASALASALRSALVFAKNKQPSLAECLGRLQREQNISLLLVLFAIVKERMLKS